MTDTNQSVWTDRSIKTLKKSICDNTDRKDIREQIMNKNNAKTYSGYIRRNRLRSMIKRSFPLLIGVFELNKYPDMKTNKPSNEYVRMSSNLLW